MVVGRLRVGGGEKPDANPAAKESSMMISELRRDTKVRATRRPMLRIADHPENFAEPGALQVYNLK